ncbi:Gamma-tubulin complex component 2 [Vitis vinifera]|uniref:Gamma-tubulin complex component n=1 Tax=Vitis vinifera TaxID=29760 RepID=A0A438EFI1_VITVI|nr:Gamma-tubulin complex component 2 [Vitis vinifera]
MDATSSCPSTPRWNVERPFLTGRFHQETKSRHSEAKGFFHGFIELSNDSPLYSIIIVSTGLEKAIACYHASVQELIVIDDLLSALVGIEGRYISIKRFRGKEFDVTFQIDASMDLALQELAKRIFPLCESFLLINQFVESRSQFKTGLVNHAFAAALRAFLLVEVDHLICGK